MKTTRRALTTLLALVLAAGCSSDEPTQDAGGSAPAESSPAPTDADGAGAGTVFLNAFVGTKADPDAKEVKLTGADGEEVTTLPAGKYTINLNDPSTKQNIHLTGPGVDEKTEVPEVGTEIVSVELKSGEYTYLSDADPATKKTFIVE